MMNRRHFFSQAAVTALGMIAMAVRPSTVAAVEKINSPKNFEIELRNCSTGASPGLTSCNNNHQGACPSNRFACSDHVSGGRPDCQGQVFCNAGHY